MIEATCDSRSDFQTYCKGAYDTDNSADYYDATYCPDCHPSVYCHDEDEDNADNICPPMPMLGESSTAAMAAYNAACPYCRKDCGIGSANGKDCNSYVEHIKFVVKSGERRIDCDTGPDGSGVDDACEWIGTGLKWARRILDDCGAGTDRRLEEVEVGSIASPASQEVAGFDPLRASQLAKLAAAAPCATEALEGGKVDLGEASAPRVVSGTGEARALLARVADGLVVTLRSALLALADEEELVSLEACAECRVSRAVAAEWATLRESLTAELAAAQKSVLKVTITGHGVSAALATLAALDLSEAGVSVAELVTFGAPRVGNAAFAVFYEDSAVFPHFRVTHGRDPVVHVPSSTAGFVHVGREVFFNKASSSYRMCARGEDPECSVSVVLATGLDDHMSYMGENFAAKYLECLVAPSQASSTKESSLLARAAKELA